MHIFIVTILYSFIITLQFCQISLCKYDLAISLCTNFLVAPSTQHIYFFFSRKRREDLQYNKRYFNCQNTCPIYYPLFPNIYILNTTLGHMCLQILSFLQNTISLVQTTPWTGSPSYKSSFSKHCTQTLNLILSFRDRLIDCFVIRHACHVPILNYSLPAQGNVLFTLYLTI